MTDGKQTGDDRQPQIAELERELDAARATIEELEQQIESTGRTLRDERDFAESLVNTAQVAVLVLDTWGCVLRVNPFFEQLTGYRLEEIAGKSWFETFLRQQDRARIRQVFAKAVAEGRIHGALNPIVTKDGREVPIEWYATTLRDRQGRAAGVLCVGADVSEQERAQSKLQESEERYRALVESSPSAIAAIQDGRIGYVNLAGARLFGLDDPAAAIGTPLLDLVAPASRDEFAEQLRYLDEGLANPLTEVELVRADGSTVTAESMSVPIALGERPAALFIGRDITERKRAEVEIRRARQDWEDIFQAIGHPTVILDPDRTVISANRAVLEILDVDERDVIGKRCNEIFHRDRRPPLSCPLERVVDTGSLETEVMEMETLGGWYLVSCTPVKHEGGQLHKVIHIATDITERKRAEDRLGASEDRYRSLVETSPDAIFQIDMTGRITSINKQAALIAGRQNSDELIGKSIYDLVPPERRQQHAQGLLDIVDSNADLTTEYELTRPDGSAVTLEVHTAITRDEQGIPTSLMGIARDVTERKQAARDLAESEARFRGTFEQAAVGIALARPDGPFVRINQRFCDIVGYTQEEMLTKTYMDITHPDDRSGTAEFVEQAISGQLDRPQMEKRYIHKDGSIVWINLTLSHVRDEDGNLIYAIGIVEDISARKRAEEQRTELEAQLLHSQRMEAIGQVVGGVAHDFNNLLSPVLLCSEMLLQDLAPNDPRRLDLEPIRAAAERAKALTRQLLAFGRRQVLSIKTLDLNRVVSNIEKMLRRTLREDIEFALKLADDSLLFQGDLSQVEQMVMNLAINARDAMPSGGTLTIETAAVDLDDGRPLERDGGSPGPHVMLAISDTGHGMDRRTLEHIFEPFFTTKARDRGSGLGLSTVYGIVKQHGGGIEVESSPGGGSTFRIYLPREAASASARDSIPAEFNAPGGEETLLVVEDDEAVRQATCRLLQSLGYRVLSAASGPEAVARAAGHGGPIDLLVSDVVMPQMNGRQVYDELVAARPGLRVLFISGYTDDVIAEHGALEPGLDYLPKPFTITQLAVKVREVIDR